MPPLSTRLLYGASGAVYAVKEAAYTMFVLLFYTQVLGLSGSITGLIIAASLIWDAISDPLVGTMSDRVRSRLGRRHPFMYFSILPMGLGFIGLFAPPAFVVESQAYLTGWLLFWSLWVRTFITSYSIPSLAHSTDITSDYQGRSQVLGVRQGTLFLTSVLVPAAALLLIFNTVDGEDGRFLSENYLTYGLLSCAVCWFMGTLSAVGTQRYAIPTHEIDPEALPSGGHGNTLTRDLLRTLSNKNFRAILGFEISMMASYGSVSALNMLVWTYYWKFSTTEISIILSAPSLLAVALVLLSLKPLGRRFEKFSLLQFSAIGLVLNTVWLYPPHMWDLFPDNHSLLFGLNFLLMLFFMYFFLLRGIQTQSITADITDEHEWDHGLRQEAGFFAALNFSSKVALIVGPLYGGLVLDFIGLEQGMMPGTVEQSVVDGLVIALGIGTIPYMIAAIYFAMRVKLTRDRVVELQTLIGERAQKNAL